MYAVVKIAGKQYKVSEGETIIVNKLENEQNETVSFDEVLLLADEGNFKIGTPYIPGIKIKARILEHFKDDKIRISRFKSKVRYRRAKGFRAKLTKIKIEKIDNKALKKSA